MAQRSAVRGTGPGTVTRPTAGALPDDDVRLDVPTRKQQWKWVVVIDRALPVGLMVNAAACISAAVGTSMPHLVGPAGVDASGLTHEGLPWTGISVLAADAPALHELRTKAEARDGLLVLDMPEVAQRSTAYAGYLDRLAETAHEDIAYHAIGIVGPRKKVDKLVGRLGLLR
jgi:hypothetical protein